MKCGSFTELRVLDLEAKSIFESAVKNIMGVGYVPMLVATQVVEGINYRFICNGTTITKEPETFAAVVTVWAKPDGSVEVTDIKKLEEAFK